MQTNTLDHIKINAGDTLTYSLSYFSKGTLPQLRVYVHVIYVDSSLRKLREGQAFATPLDQYTHFVFAPFTVTGEVDKIRFTLYHRSKGGRVFVDDVSLLHTPGQ